MLVETLDLPPDTVTYRHLTRTTIILSGTLIPDPERSASRLAYLWQPLSPRPLSLSLTHTQTRSIQALYRLMRAEKLEEPLGFPPR